MSGEIPFGLWTPAQAIDELIDMARKDPSKRAWYPRRMRQIRDYLATVRFKERPILDEPMSVNAIDAVIKEAWQMVKRRQDGGEGWDPIKHAIEEMAARGQA